jgi:hypothetical protein
MAEPNLNTGFPLKGIFKGGATGQQPDETTSDALNMRPYCTLDGRMRGCQRPGLDKWGAGIQIGGSLQPVVAMCSVSSVA